MSDDHPHPPPEHHRPGGFRCPGCGAGAGGAAGAHSRPPRCPGCGLPLAGPLPERLAEIDAELWRLGARQHELAAERHRLLRALRASAESAAAPQWPSRWQRPVPAAGPAGSGDVGSGYGGFGHGGGDGQGREASPPTARNVLLTLGGLLLAVAATAFTLLSWGSMGIGGRAAVLATCTLALVTAPALLVPRGLRATAESLAALGPVLLLLDAYALHRVAYPGADGWGFAAVSCAAVSALWAGYGLLPPVRGLRLPLPVALGLAQAVLPLWATAAGAGAQGYAWALLGTAVGDALLALHAPGRAAGLRTAAVAASLSGAAGITVALGLSVTAGTPLAALRAAALLLTASAVALHAALRLPSPPTPHGPPAAETPAATPPRAASLRNGPALVGGLALVAGAGGVVRTAMPSPQWWVPGYLLCAAALLAATLPRVLRGTPAVLADGLRAAALTVCGGAVLWTAPAVTQALVAPLGRLGRAWEGAPEGVREALTPGTTWLGGGAVPVVLAGASAVAATAHRLLPDGGPRRPQTRHAAFVTGLAAVVVLPPALGMPYLPAVLLLLLLVVLLLGLYAAGAVRTRPAAVAALAAALAPVPSVLGLALAEQAVTLLTLAVLSLGCGGAATAAARVGTPAGRHAAVPACVAVLGTAGFAYALAQAAGVPLRYTAFALLAVGFAALATASVSALRARPALGAPLEVTAACVALAGVVAAAGSAAWLSLALGLCGLAAGALALRADRRRPAVAASGVLMLCAAWVRLYASEVTVPEAYTLPVTLLALPLGHLRRRSTEGASSWTAYGPGLAATLLPSLVVAWDDPAPLRPLLLGLAALAVTLTGARHSLQAPLLLGTGTLAAVALHELTPYLEQVVGVLPRWLPTALAGALLLAVGATYEKRLDELRRLRSRIGRMS